MTFKHIKFSDSSVMRSLEKVALNKGLVKIEEIKKEASKQDLKVTDNLLVNLMKLSSGLRSKGLLKYAEDLEEKIILYKQSIASSKEFDPILNEAHNSSTKLKDLDHTVKTLLDVRLDMLRSINSPSKVKLAFNKLFINKIGQSLNLDVGKDKELNQLEFQDNAWISEDGSRVNAKFISEKLEPQALKFNEVLKQLNELKSLSTDSRFSPEVSKAIGSAINLVGSLLKDYVMACKNAYNKARELELSRLKNVNDLNQSRISFSEVGGNFKLGVLSKINIGKSNNFNELLNNVTTLEKELGNLIFDRLAPGFDFDEDFMQSIKSKGMSHLNKIKNILGS